MTISYGPSMVTDGLVMYLDAANPRSYPGSGTTFSWWYNSVLDRTITASYNLADNTAGMNICYAQTWGGTYPGSISVVQIYNYALAAGQISQNFNAHRGRFGI